ncbi:hypothetical protein K1719_022210 [Acacia pycnantha]|nr:hypothetical protein K1719_022210 [Acacia pycnantha]
MHKGRTSRDTDMEVTNEENKGGDEVEQDQMMVEDTGLTNKAQNEVPILDPGGDPLRDEGPAEEAFGPNLNISPEIYEEVDAEIGSMGTGIRCFQTYAKRRTIGRISDALENSVSRVEVVSEDRQYIHVKCAFPGRSEFMLTAVYAVPHSNLRSLLWAKMKQFADSILTPWMAIGDFNDILALDERVGASVRNLRRIAWFNDRIRECGLSDLGFKGPKFTWKGPRMNGYARIFERLDRGLANAEFLSDLNSV